MTKQAGTKVVIAQDDELLLVHDENQGLARRSQAKKFSVLNLGATGVVLTGFGFSTQQTSGVSATIAQFVLIGPNQEVVIPASELFEQWNAEVSRNNTADWNQITAMMLREKVHLVLEFTTPTGIRRLTRHLDTGMGGGTHDTTFTL